MVYEGWYQIAFESEILEELTAVDLDERRLLIVRTEEGISVVDADCPHRGAHLAAGRLANDAVVCPFHGYRIGLGRAHGGCDHGFSIRTYPTLVAAGAVFTRLSDAHDHGFADALQTLLADHFIAGSFTFHVNAAAPLVCENGFDAAHFEQVHDIQQVLNFTTRTGANGSLVADGLFEIAAADRLQTEAARIFFRVPYSCTAFSPYLVLSRLGGDFPYAILTGGTPTRTGGAVIRLSLALPPGTQSAAHILAHSRAGIEKDSAIWEAMARPESSHFTPRDAAVVAFRQFCRGFVPEEHP